MSAKMRKMDFYSKEGALINLSQRELDNGLEKEPIEKLRLMCFSRGSAGVLGLARTLRNMDREWRDTLTLDEFIEGVKEAGLKLGENELTQMFRSWQLIKSADSQSVRLHIDEERSGTINVSDFLEKLRPPMSKSRQELVNKAFTKLDRKGDKVLTADDFKRVYNVHNHPKYKSGELTENEIVSDILKNFDGGRGKLVGEVTEEEFKNYYACISASIDHDGYFDLMMRQSFKL